MKKIFVFAVSLIVFAEVSHASAPKTTFGIIADKATYDNCAQELNAYRDVLCSEGLNAVIIAQDWENPDQVKCEILKLRSSKPALEGVVFVGDVPIVMVRGAQFMTTAFKMDEDRYPVFESSVPSDRFYDDFDLDFKFISKDEEHDGVFYYKLTSNGSTVLSPDIYSARMKVPEMMRGDKYEIMRKYLRKVVTAHVEQGNTLDNMTYFAGHGYNSDCLTVWRQKPGAFREVFPLCFNRSSSNRFLNFREHPEMKFRLFNELQRPGIDYFQFSEHGDYDTQYINGDAENATFTDCVNAIKSSVAYMYRRYKGTPDEEEFCHEVMDSLFHINRSEFSDSAMAAIHKADSIKSENLNITLSDLAGISTNARVVILNACYNGSFHNPEGYIAGFHVFSDGDCIVAQGNTVNVLQDKWEDKLIGYLGLGERIGMWQKELCFLESHLIGDPTFRFASANKADEKVCAQLHHDLVFNSGKASVWKKYCKSDKALLRAAGIVHLSSIDDCSNLAFDMLCNDDSPMVRLHALNVLWGYADANMENAIKVALNDPYEAVMRTAARMAEEMDAKSLAPELEEVIKRNPEMLRVSFQANAALDIINVTKRHKAEIKLMADKSASEKKRIGAVRSFRNDNVYEVVDTLLAIVFDEENPMALRQSACETLGWFKSNVRREEIAAALEKADFNDSELMDEVGKTVKRLRHI